MRIVRTVVLFLMVIASVAVQAQNISKKKVKKHIKTLSSDKYLGRGVGEEGERLAADYIAKQFKSLKLKPMGDSGTYFHHFSFKFKVNPHSEDGAVEKNGKNVVAFLDNGATNTIIIGAHYDHLGMGHVGSSRDANPEGKIHNGADDNASGTAGVLELARYFAKNKTKENCNFMFICFSAEEQGLVGSKKFTEYGSFNAATTQCMINMDMIGRLNDSTKKIMVYGVGTSPVWGNMVQTLKPASLAIGIDSSGTGPTDHTSFYLKDVPVLSFFTGQHKQYHTPEDDAHLINYDGTVEVIRYIASICDKVAAMPKPEFTKTKNSDNENRVSFKVTLGIMPDYVFEGPGVKVDGVTAGKPADKAGVKAGDILLFLGGVELKGMKEYMNALSQHKKGDKTTLKVHRGAAILEFEVEF
jgi:hypothetical protein